METMEPGRYSQGQERSTSSWSSSSSSVRIVPRGFESMSHPIFQQYRPPVYRSTNHENSARSQVHDSKPSIHTLVIPSATALPSYSSGISHTAVIDHPKRTPCPICLQPILRPVTVVSPSNCAHSYCFGCLFRWFQQRTVCPLCNTHAAAFVTFVAHAIEQDQGQHQESTSSTIIPKLHPNTSDSYTRNFSNNNNADRKNIQSNDYVNHDGEVQLWKFISQNTASKVTSTNSTSESNRRLDLITRNSSQSIISNSNIDIPVIDLTDIPVHISTSPSSPPLRNARKRKLESESEERKECANEEEDPSVSYALTIHRQRFPVYF